MMDFIEVYQTLLNDDNDKNRLFKGLHSNFEDFIE